MAIAYMIKLVALVYNCTCDKIYREYENDYAIPDITHGCGLRVLAECSAVSVVGGGLPR